MFTFTITEYSPEVPIVFLNNLARVTLRRVSSSEHKLTSRTRRLDIQIVRQSNSENIKFQTCPFDRRNPGICLTRNSDNSEHVTRSKCSFRQSLKHRGEWDGIFSPDRRFTYICAWNVIRRADSSRNAGLP
jgi:hypothetical protein